ncbi:MAG: ABC transporter substrate-binding protein [Candidatus Gastranaerophilales bacterium]|nr:ABC transporter substrate-binding protein [Candidatus Gastranaerophilales bacterium]
MRCKKWMAVMLTVVLMLGLVGCGNNRTQKVTLTVCLHNIDLLGDYAKWLQAAVPEVDLEFIVGRDSVDFYLFQQEHGELPDIITMGGSLFLRDSQELDGYLMDLSETETAASFYDTYLEAWRAPDGSVNWLPAGGVANGIIANVDLFEEYNIPLPTDYPSFASACAAFRELGIQPYTSDYKYTYTSLYTLEGFAASTLMSRQGAEWRRNYQKGQTDSLDEALWTEAFERFSQVLDDTGLPQEDAARGYSMTYNDFVEGNIPMVRGMISEITAYSAYCNCILLPYFGDTAEDNWILTVPRFCTALNGALDEKGNEQKKEAALKVLAAMYSEEGYQAMTSGDYLYMLPYNRGVNIQVPEMINNLQGEIEANRLFILMSSESLQSAAHEAVQGMLLEDWDAGSAFEKMNAALADPVIDREIVATLEAGYPVRFQPDTGNQAGSAIANTLREIGGSDFLLAPSSISPCSLYAGDYTAQRVEESVQSSGNGLYTAELTGAEVREIVRLAVEGCGSYNDPFSDQTLPIVSGLIMEVEKTPEGNYRLAGLETEDGPLEDGASYSFAIADLHTGFQPLVETALGVGGTERFSLNEKYARVLWTEYLTEGGQPLAPTTYITLRETK